MKFIISRLELLDLINRAQGIVNPKPLLPILANVCVQAANDEVVLTTMDSGIGIRCYCETKVLEEGTTTLPLKRLSQLVRELTAMNLELTTQNDVTELLADTAKFKLIGMNPVDYPSLPDLSGAIKFVISQATLKEMFYRTSFAVPKDEQRFILTGVFVQIANSIATFVGTDGRSLSRSHVEVNLPKEFSGNYSIPLKAVEEIARNLVEDPQETATIHLLHDRIAVEANHVTIISKLLEGDYPDYAEVIPQTSESMVKVHREEFTSILRQIALFTSDKSPSARFALGDGELKLSKNSMDVGEGKVSMPVDYRGEKLEIAFNPHCMLNILRHCKQEIVTLGLIDPYNPGVVADQNSPYQTTAQPNPLYVIMPMRLSEV